MKGSRTESLALLVHRFACSFEKDARLQMDEDEKLRMRTISSTADRKAEAKSESSVCGRK